MRFSLKTLLAATTFLAVTIVGALYPNRMWAAVCFTAVFVWVLVAIVAACTRRGSARAYWSGFAVCSALYLLTSIYGDVQPHIGSRGSVESWQEPRLITSELLLWGDAWLTKLRPARARGLMAGSDYVRAMYPVSFAARGWTGHTLIIGHSLLAVLFGCFGGWAGNWFYRREPAS